MQHLFTSIYDFFVKRKALLLLLFIITLGIFIVLSTRLHFVEDIYAIIPKDKKTAQISSIFQNSKFADKLTVMVSLKDSTKTNPDALVSVTDSIAGALEQQAQPLYESIRYKTEDEPAMELLALVQNHLPVFLTENDYKKIDTLIQPAALQKTLQKNIELLSSPSSFLINDIISNDPSGISFIGLKKLQQLQVDDNYELYDNHIITKDHKTALLFITPKAAQHNQQLFAVLDKEIAALEKLHPSIFVEYFGGAVVANSNATQLKKDTAVTLSITTILLIAFIGYYFRKKRAPFIIFIPVIYGAAFSLAMIYIIKGTISTIAIGTGAIVLGIVINYSLHLFNHKRHIQSMRQTIHDLAFPLTIGSFTTVAGFLCLQFAASDMLKDLGLFAGFSLVGAAFCTLVFLPHFIGRQDKSPVHHNQSWLDKIASFHFETNKWLVFAILILTIIFFHFSQKAGFDPDMTRLNYMPPNLRQTEEKFNQINGGVLKSVYVVAQAHTLDEALRKAERLNTPIMSLIESGKILSSSGATVLFISDSLQRKRIEDWKRYWTNEKKTALIANIQREGIALGFKPNAFNPFIDFINTDFTAIDTIALQDIRQGLLNDYFINNKGQTGIITLLKIPEQYRKDVINGLEKQHSVTVLDRQYFTERLTQLVSDDFNKITWIVSAIVLIVLLITFGRFELMLMAFIPMAVSWIWILGIMGITGTRFNLVNIIISALIFGLGDDYSLFIMDGLLNEYKTGKKLLGSYKSSILLSAVTTIVGLGVMIFAKHPALKSVAFISVTGILCVVVMSQLLIPFLFSLVIKNRARKKFHPWTIWSWSRSVFSFFYFGFVSILLTITGLFLIKLNILGAKKGKHIYHYLLSKFCKSVLYIMGNFRKRVVNPHHENFEKPAVVIANHQSFLDILAMAMLNPKLILLTNQWVWNSPVFGWAIKMADFYPVANGIENSVDLLNHQIQNGYSIVVFPEGTRSTNPPMKRFHKGAFYLAEKLQLDIVPVLLHGWGYTMTKGDYLLKNGPVTAKYLPRIQAADTRWGTSYQEKTKSISSYFKKQHHQLTREQEQPKYFKEHLFFNYIYKGPVLEWYLKFKLRLENYYQLFHELMPQRGTILDLGCGYGFMSYMLYWSSQQQRIITGVDYDEDKIDTANHCFSKTDDIQFITKDITQFNVEKYNGIIISDVLHYLIPEQQITVIEKAILALEPGGILVIRDGDKDLKEKHKGTKLTEFFSTKIFAFNKTINQLHFLSGKMIEQLAKKHKLSLEYIDHTQFTSNVIWVLRKKGFYES